MKNYLIVFIIVLLVSAGCSFTSSPNPAENNSTNSENSAIPNQTETTTSVPTTVKSDIQSPINNPQNRVTKKLFGIYITPKNSPVSPERFTGYHTGLDFETTPEEKDLEIKITAICSGKVLRKSYASGYGGVLVQSCQINNQDVTVVYGHLKLASISQALGSEVKTGQTLGVLGQGYSQETDGERKHLHLSIHKGKEVNVKGYVKSQTELSNWIDPEEALNLES